MIKKSARTRRAERMNVYNYDIAPAGGVEPPFQKRALTNLPNPLRFCALPLDDTGVVAAVSTAVGRFFALIFQKFCGGYFKIPIKSTFRDEKVLSDVYPKNTDVGHLFTLVRTVNGLYC
jgi:hypothetical protein